MENKGEKETINVALVPNSIKSNGFGIASLILGIVGFITSFFGVGMFFAILSIIFAIIGLIRKDRKKGSAIAGLVIGIVAFFIALIALVFFDAVGTAIDETSKELKKMVIVSKDGTEKDITSDTKISLGSKVKTSSLEITYIKFNKDVKDYEDYEKPKDGYKYISADFEFTNISEDDEYISYTDFDCYADNYSVESSYIGDNDLDATLSKGKKTKGTVYFQVPKDAKDVVIQYTPNFLVSDAKLTFECK